LQHGFDGAEMKVAKITTHVNGEIDIVRLEMPELTVASALANLRVKKLCPMDKAELIEGDVVIELAQDKPFTYITHVFVAPTAS
jgi:hypothetical protein